MRIMLYFFLLISGYMSFALIFIQFDKKLGLCADKKRILHSAPGLNGDSSGAGPKKKDHLIIIVLLLMCGILFSGRLSTPYLSLWIKVPEGLKNVDKGLIVRCFFDYLFLLTLIMVGYIDYKKHIIPNTLNGLIILFGIVTLCISVFFPAFKVVEVHERLTGMLILSIPLIIIGQLYQGSIGMGDVKFLACAGFYMGWKKLMIGTFAGSIIAAIICFISILGHKLNRKDKIAFGPYLCIGMAYVTLSGWFM